MIKINEFLMLAQMLIAVCTFGLFHAGVGYVAIMSLIDGKYLISIPFCLFMAHFLYTIYVEEYKNA